MFVASCRLALSVGVIACAALGVRAADADMVRPTRALEVLERLGTLDAKQLLEELAKCDPGAPLTRDARATLKRLGDATAPGR